MTTETSRGPRVQVSPEVLAELIALVRTRQPLARNMTIEELASDAADDHVRCDRRHAELSEAQLQELAVQYTRQVITEMSRESRPIARPKCRHGGSPITCRACGHDAEVARKAIKPLITAYWEHQGKNAGDLELLLMRAYKLGQDSVVPSEVTRQHK